MKKPRNPGGKLVPYGPHLPADENVIAPPQVKHAAAVANALASGQPLPTRPKPTLETLSDAEIEQVLQRLKPSAEISQPDFDLIRELAERGAQDIIAHRRGARKPRANSGAVTRRMEAELEAYRRLSKKRGLNVSEDTLRHDLQQMALLLRLVRKGIVPPAGPRPAINAKLSKKTQREMVAGKRTLAKHRSGR